MLDDIFFVGRWSFIDSAFGFQSKVFPNRFFLKKKVFGSTQNSVTQCFIIFLTVFANEKSFFQPKNQKLFWN